MTSVGFSFEKIETAQYVLIYFESMYYLVFIYFHLNSDNSNPIIYSVNYNIFHFKIQFLFK